MDDDRVEIILLVVDADGGLYADLGHDLAVFLLGHAVLEPLDADDEIVGEFGDEVSLDGLRYEGLTFYLFSLQKSHTKSFMISMAKEESMVSSSVCSSFCGVMIKSRKISLRSRTCLHPSHWMAVIISP